MLLCGVLSLCPSSFETCFHFRNAFSTPETHLISQSRHNHPSPDARVVEIFLGSSAVWWIDAQQQQPNSHNIRTTQPTAIAALFSVALVKISYLPKVLLVYDCSGNSDDVGSSSSGGGVSVGLILLYRPSSLCRVNKRTLTRGVNSVVIWPASHHSVSSPDLMCKTDSLYSSYSSSIALLLLCFNISSVRIE